ncbi:MAG: hypothetical protein ACXWXG_08270 [Actinomycetota bacterium]
MTNDVRERSTHARRRSKRLGTVGATLPAVMLAALLMVPDAANAGGAVPDPTVSRTDVSTSEGGGSGSEGGDSASGSVPPGGLLTTRDGPIDAADPFAVGLKNIGDQTLDATIQEEACDGSQGNALCSVPRVGGVAGNFIFQPADLGRRHGASSSGAVTVAKLFYDKSVLVGVDGFKIFYQKTDSSPVIRLPRCGDGVKTECFQSKRRSNGDEIVRVRLSNDPRVTRG